MLNKLNIEGLNKEINISNLKNVENIKEIPLRNITPNEKNFYAIEENDVRQLANNIEMVGQLEPLIVKGAEVPGKYTLISGHRRYNALLLLEQKNESDVNINPGYAKCIIVDIHSEEEEELLIIEANNQRIKTKEEIDKEIILKKEKYTELKNKGIEKYKNCNIAKLISKEMGVSERKVYNSIKKDNIELHPKENKNTYTNSINKLLKDIDKIMSKYHIFNENQKLYFALENLQKELETEVKSIDSK